MITRLILIRHGITAWNKERRYCGCKDIPLSRLGKAQAKRLQRRLKGFSFERIYCSDRKRALETRRIIFGKAKFAKVKGLREINFGVLEGLRHKEIMRKYAKAYEKWLRDPYRNNIPKAEKMDAFKKRVRSSIKKIASLNPGKTVAVVCHGGVIGVLLGSILKTRDFWQYVPEATSITVLEFNNGRARIKKFNDTTHLG